ncbi:type II 3-dehydroquinate dehydratase [Sphingomonas xanthus]|uniref:3-dehydroquinate dehydratase n=1 Tax=Sphingomonas xanthus TaxID=2594473 RepID=A0A516IPZ2_9SPHN|nr:type II 3-dehydroquinate dehydratase [Sphingomonas xanthus]QDP18971.1 3-dehydroquinate dehydratase [Sphingomonas xanthus]
MATPPLIFILNGPNLNLLGRREPEIYGSDTLDDIAAMMTARAGELGVRLDIRQTNHEGHLIDWLHEAQDAGARAVIINPGGYSHSSVALHDAVRAITTPVIAVHLSDPETRESFRHVDLVALAATKVFKGEGAKGYLSALDAAARL